MCLMLSCISSRREAEQQNCQPQMSKYQSVKEINANSDRGRDSRQIIDSLVHSRRRSYQANCNCAQVPSCGIMDLLNGTKPRSTHGAWKVNKVDTSSDALLVT
ncbi:hypothetical protein NPIL_482251 [Nephila pilipes]|uniref:Uncharacterized protein n=1 Tax=Nephila pilipes TaxID=299642 RepID=A0A8X6J928_NEPPI|nr:hypothetical protein NPIL_482251 [Nephila pilipes]